MEKLFKAIDKLAYWLTAIILTGMVGTIVLQVVTRAFTISIAWTMEISQYLFICLTFVAGYLGARKNQHIGVELITGRLPDLPQRIVRCVAYMVAAGFYLYVVYLCGTMMPTLAAETSTMLHIPMSVIYGFMAVCLAFMSLYFIYQGVVLFVPNKKKESEL